MAIDLRKVAQKATTLAEIMEGKTKGNTEDLIKLNKPVTINDCEMVVLVNEEGEKENVWAFTIEEEPKTFYFAGTVLKNTFQAILEACQGDYAEMYNEVCEQNLVVKFSQGKTKKGRPVTTIEVL